MSLRHETLREIADIALRERRCMGEQFFADAAERAVAAGLTASGREGDLGDAMACEMLRCRVVNHVWNGAIG